jgi:hypothetical protein
VFPISGPLVFLLVTIWLLAYLHDELLVCVVLLLHDNVQATRCSTTHEHAVNKKLCEPKNLTAVVLYQVVTRDPPGRTKVKTPKVDQSS